MLKRTLLAVAVLVLGLSLQGCILLQTGTANTSGQVGGDTVNLGGTVFCWWDTTVFQFDADAGNFFRQTRDGKDQTLHIALFGFMFNPKEDRRFWSVDQRQEYSHQMDLSDSLSFTVNVAGSLSNSARLEYNTENPPNTPDVPFLSEPYFSQAPVRVNEKNTYPDQVKREGSRRVYVLELKQVEREVSKIVKGSFEVKIEKSDADPSDVVTGSVRGDFEAPVIGERIAECNFNTQGAGLGVNPCDDLEMDGENA